jgi:DNA topoisomerase VI subunit A
MQQYEVTVKVVIVAETPAVAMQLATEALEDKNYLVVAVSIPEKTTA